MTQLRTILKGLSPKQRESYFNSLSAKDLESLKSRWEVWARDNQLAPEGDWSVWLLLAGRGFGKTRCIIEWMRQKIAESKTPIRFAIVGSTLNDITNTIIRGHSGIMNVFPREELPEIHQNNRLLNFPDGSMAQWFCAEEPDRLRGPQFHYAICDEMAAWTYLEDTWRNLRMMLRLGKNPQIAIATTPKPLPFLRTLVKDPSVKVVQGSTYENRDNLSPAYFTATIKDFEGTRYGKQEIDGQLLDDIEGSLFERRWFRYRDGKEEIFDPRRYQSIVVAIDPATSSNYRSDLTGIIVAGKTNNGDADIIADHSGRYTPDEWARVAINLYHRYSAHRILAEVNQGGDMVEKILRTVEPNIKYFGVHASKGKVARAEPVAALYQQGKVYHPAPIFNVSGVKVPALQALENQLADYVPGQSKSPDRMDAMVWAVSYLLLNLQPPARGLIKNRVGWF